MYGNGAGIAMPSIRAKKRRTIKVRKSEHTECIAGAVGGIWRGIAAVQTATETIWTTKIIAWAFVLCWRSNSHNYVPFLHSYIYSSHSLITKKPLKIKGLYLSARLDSNQRPLRPERIKRKMFK